MSETLHYIYFDKNSFISSFVHCLPWVVSSYWMIAVLYILSIVFLLGLNIFLPIVLVFCLFACLFSLFVGFFNLVFNTFCYTHLGNCSCCYQYASYFNGYIHHQFTQSMNYIQFSYFFPIKTLPFGFYDFLCQFPINLLNLLCCFILSWLASWCYYFSRPKAGPSTLLFLHLLPRLSYPFTWL